jgi:hypothetical protein
MDDALYKLYFPNTLINHQRRIEDAHIIQDKDNGEVEHEFELFKILDQTEFPVRYRIIRNPKRNLYYHQESIKDVCIK